MKQIVFVILCLLTSVTYTFAQGKPEITVDKAVHDFGKVNEADGDISCEFVIKNTGNAPLVISRVTASCGCTTPDWTKSPIAPGASGSVKATYGAKGRPGPFSKTISVYTNAKEGGHILTIKGDVIPKPQTPEAAYPIAMGDLRLNKSTAYFNMIKNTEKRSDIFEAYNNGKTPIQVSFLNLPSYITATSSPASIEPGKTGKIILSYNAGAAKKFGSFTDKVGVSVNSKKDNGYSILVKSTIVENFGNMTAAERENAPVLSLDPVTINFNNLPKVKTADLKITNTGKSKLIIHNVQSEASDLLSVHVGKKEIKPGKSEIIKVNLDPSKVARNTSAYINIVSNDPKAAFKRVRAIISLPSN